MIAKALADSSDKDEVICAFLEFGIVDNCKNCDIRDICAGIDNLVEEHRKNTSKVIADFSF